MIKNSEDSWVKEYENCNLCEWKCGVNRTKETGVCNTKMPEVAYTCLSEPLKSYSITLPGCNFTCLFCDAYQLSQPLNTSWYFRDYIDPKKLAKETADRIGKKDIERITFTGGEASVNLPYIEKFSKEVKRILPEIKIGLSTNGFETEDNMKRAMDICSYATFEIKAFNKDTHLALTGAPIEPVLRNAEYLLKNKGKARAFRTVVIPRINDHEIEDIAKFIASVDSSTPYNLIGFRPFYILTDHPGPTSKEMENITERCRKHLEKVTWCGSYPEDIKLDGYGAELAKRYAELSRNKSAECKSEKRVCKTCELDKSCSGSTAMLKSKDKL